MKKVLSVLICIVLLTGISVPAFAGKKEVIPFVLVSGMDVLPLYSDYGTEQQQKAWPFAGEDYLNLGKNLALPVAKYCVDKNKNELKKAVFNAVNILLEKLKCDSDGNSVYNIQTPQFPTSMAENEWVYKDENKDEQGILNAAVEKYGADNVYFFNYDWRLDPLEHADRLNNLVENIKKEKNCEKVNIACCSMGGVISMSYLYKYGYDSVNNFMLLSTAFQGVTAVGDMFSGDIYLEKNALIRRVVNLGKGNLKEFLFKALMYAVDKSGAADVLVDFADDFINSNIDDIYDIVLKDTFGQMPGIIDLIAAEDYEEAKSYMLDKNKNAYLIERTDEYIYNVQCKAKNILDSAKEDGVGVYIVCQYNMQSLPVSHSSDLNNDLLIDVKYASAGAICADLDCKLPEGYVQQIDDGHNHISPDNVVDASTCMYPECTWFIKNQAHVDYNCGATTDFIFWLADSDGKASVHDNEMYSQFMIYDYDDNSLLPMNTDYKEPFDYFSAFSKTADFIISIYKKIIYLIFNIIKEAI